MTGERVWPPAADAYLQTPRVLPLIEVRLQAERVLAEGLGVFDTTADRATLAELRSALRRLEGRVVRIPGPTPAPAPATVAPAEPPEPTPPPPPEPPRRRWPWARPRREGAFSEVRRRP